MEVYVLLKNPVFRNITASRLESFMDRTSSAIRSYPAGDFIAMQDTPYHSLYFLCKGKVRTRMVNDVGKQITIEEMEAPRLLAPAFIYASENRFPVNVQTLTECEVWVVNKDDFTQLMHEEPVIMENFLRIISDRSLFLSKKLNAFALQDLKGRLAAYLLENPDARNQQEIADILGVARPSLARIISELSDEGMIFVEKRKIKVLDHEQLKRYVSTH
ncbi:MAG: Crp/Fnr family transcriptional regulator [Bacteroidales bacterium]|nr:Crp/Fnr family transcriptional regulator [Bacteroidales bacterium]